MIFSAMANYIRDYYHSQFRNDLVRFLPSRDVPYFGHSWTHDCDSLQRVLSQNRPAFLICLYFTVLFDQAMYEHFRIHYSRFEAVTRYPKFCHGLGQFHKNPRAILAEPIERYLVNETDLEELLPLGMNLFVSEIVSFFRDHLQEVTSADFLDKLRYDPDVQIPEILVIVDPTIKDRIEYKAYRALTQAIENAFTNGVF